MTESVLATATTNVREIETARCTVIAQMVEAIDDYKSPYMPAWHSALSAFAIRPAHDDFDRYDDTFTTRVGLHDAGNHMRFVRNECTAESMRYAHGLCLAQAHRDDVVSEELRCAPIGPQLISNVTEFRAITSPNTLYFVNSAQSTRDAAIAAMRTARMTCAIDVHVACAQNGDRTWCIADAILVGPHAHSVLECAMTHPRDPAWKCHTLRNAGDVYCARHAALVAQL